jgi:hypothetical protein
MQTYENPANYPKAQLLSVKELIKEYGFSQSFWRTLIREKKVVTVYFGRSLRVRRDSVERYIQQNTRKGEL